MMARKHPPTDAGQPHSPVREIGSTATFVRERRRAAGLSQRELSELAGVGPRAIWDLERGKATLRMDVVNRVLAVFGKRLGPLDAPRDEGDA
jgi:y4mF family transcriptional regulator